MMMYDSIEQRNAGRKWKEKQVTDKKARSQTPGHGRIQMVCNNAPIQRTRDHVSTLYTYMFAPLPAAGIPSAPLYGPHTFAHAALDYQMEEYEWEGLYREQVEPYNPNVVYGIIRGNMPYELPETWETEEDWEAESDPAVKDKINRIKRFMKDYAELYQWLSDSDNRGHPEYEKKLFQIISMHPYGVYGWQREERAGRQELDGKGELVIKPGLRESKYLFDQQFTFAPPYLFPYLADNHAEFADQDEYREFLNTRVMDLVPGEEWLSYQQGMLELDNPRSILCETCRYMVYVFYKKCIDTYYKLIGEIEERQALGIEARDLLDGFYEESTGVDELVESLNKLKEFQPSKRELQKPENYQLEVIRDEIAGIPEFTAAFVTDYDLFPSATEEEDMIDFLSTYRGAMARNILSRMRCTVKANALYECIRTPVYLDAAEQFLSLADGRGQWFNQDYRMDDDIAAPYSVLLQLPVDEIQEVLLNCGLFLSCKRNMTENLRMIGREESPSYTVAYPK